MTRQHRRIPVLALVPILAACGSNPGGSPLTVAPTAPPTSAAAPSTTTAPSGLQLLGIGDSYMSQQDSKGQTFVDAYGALLKAAGKGVVVSQLASGQYTTMLVLSKLDDPDVAAQVQRADIIVLSVGGNDVDPFGVFPAGTCAPSQPWKECLAAYASDFEGNTDKILTRIEQLRAGTPTAIRVLGADNPFVGWDQAPTPTFGADFFAQVARAETNAVCEVAAVHHARCIDILSVIGGPSGTEDPAKYLDKDHSHPGDLGIATIADLLMKSGLAELG